MLTARIKIGTNGTTVDSRQYGLVYLDSDKRVAAPTKGFESTAYPEEEGEHVLAKTVDAAFDYTAKFYIQATSLKTANAMIADFNAMLYTQEAGSDVKQYKQVALFNDNKRHKIVGIPNPIAEAEEFWRDKHNQVKDVVVVEWTIRVDKPSLCNFSAAE